MAEYLFKHPLTQEVALTSQLQERRRKLHAAVARVIEAAHQHDLDQQAALLAHHWEEAADLPQAVRWHRRAAEWAGARDPIEGMRHWRKVRDLGHSADGADVKEARLRACAVILAGGSWRLGMSEDEMRGLLDEGRALAQELGHPSAIATMLVGVAAHLGVLGRAEPALEVADEALAMIDDNMDRSEVVSIETATHWLLVAGRLPQALAAFERVAERCGGDTRVGREVVGYSPAIWAEHQIAMTLAQLGRFDECWPHAARALRLAREQNARENLGWALGTPSWMAYLARGTSRLPFNDLRAACLQGLEIAETAGSRYSQIVQSCALAMAHFLSGDYAECEERIRDALEQAEGAGTALDFQSFYLTVVADSRLARGDVEAAIASAREGIEFADAGGAWFQCAVARAALADALVVAGTPEEEIARVIAEARELVRRSGGNSLLPRLREAEARLAGRTNRDALIAGLREAEAMYRAIGAPDPAERLAHELAS